MTKPKKIKVAKLGRPSSYSQEIANKVCHELSMGRSLRTVCAAEDMPAIATIFNWFATYPLFLEQYARAKVESADALAEEILDIADDTIKVIKSGAEKKSSAYAQAQRLRVDSRKWIMSKMKPKKYGDTIDVKSDGKAIQGNVIIFKSFKDEPSKDNESGGK